MGILSVGYLSFVVLAAEPVKKLFHFSLCPAESDHRAAIPLAAHGPDPANVIEKAPISAVHQLHPEISRLENVNDGVICLHGELRDGIPIHLEDTGAHHRESRKFRWHGEAFEPA